MTITVPMGPATVDITGVRAGDQNLMSMTLTVDGAPMDLAGMEVAAQARLTPTAVESIDAVITVTGLNTIAVRWPGEAVAEMLAGKPTWKGVWDLQVGEPGLDPVTVAAGKFTAVMDVTR